MSFLEALYGGQYYEIQKNGRDGNKGRINGNVFLTAFIILFIIAILMICFRFVPDFNETLTRSLRKTFGNSSGKTIGKLLAIPVFAIIYFTILKTAGTADNFKRHTENFMKYPDEIKKKANAKLLIPFFILLAIVLGLAMSSL